jgi:flagellar protein FlgJ
MKPVGLVPAALDPAALAQAKATDASKQAPNARSAETVKAAREFEALLLRRVLESLQKTTKIGGGESHANTAYQSMAVDALADGISRAGGLGLADLIAKTLESEIAGRRP